MIFDIHTHLLPNVDDGSKSLERSIELIQDEINNGVTDIILTPHYHIRWIYFDSDILKVEFEKFKKEVQNRGLKVNLYLGNEIHYYKEIFEENYINNRACSLNNTNYILVEFSWNVKPDLNVIKEIIDYGYIPIIAHYERFPYKNIDDVKEMRSNGALFQINAYSLFGVESEEHKEFAFQMLDNNLVDFIASDYHHFKPNPLKEAYELIYEKYGQELRDNVFYNNAKRLFTNDNSINK